MSALREAAQKALAALSLSRPTRSDEQSDDHYLAEREAHMDAIKALRAALAEPEQEPVAWLHKHGNYKDASLYQISDMDRIKGWTESPLYTNPSPDHRPGQLVVTKNDSGQIVSVTRQDSDGRVIEVIAESTEEKK